MHRPFRFIHTSDLHLDRPIRGLAEVPNHLRDAFVDAPYRAAERVFDAALREQVEFVVMAGDVVDPLASGPRGLVFLQEQCERLAAAGIAVYWAGGRSDHFERWIELPMPESVVRFPLGQVQSVTHERHGEPVAQIVGTSCQQRKKIRADSFRADASGLFVVAVAQGAADAELLAGEDVNYWALGGEHHRQSLLTGAITGHYCGTPQGRRPQESGPHGCTLVHVDETRRPRTSFIPTDAVRFHVERVAGSESTSVEQLHEILDQRVGELLGDPFGPEVLVQWTVTGSKSLAAELTRGTAAAELTARLRADHGSKRPAAWTISIEAETGGPVERDRYEEDTLLGEFLRTVQHHVDHGDEPLDLEPYLDPRHAAGHVGALVTLDDSAARRRVLAEVAQLGIELLSPEDHAR